MNDHLKAQPVMNDSMSKLREMFQTWLQQQQEQMVNLDTYTPEPSQCRKIPICYDDDDDEETTESNELMKSSVEDLIHTLSESDGISESECDWPVCDDSSPKKDEVLDDIISIPPGNGNDHFCAESSLTKSVLNRDKKISSPKIDFLLKELAGELALIAPIQPGIASPPDSELVSLEVVDIVIPKVGGIDTDILLTIKDDIPREIFLNWEAHFLFGFSLHNYEAFFSDSEPNSGNFTMVVVEDIFDNPTREPRVHVPNILPTHPNLQLDSDFTLSSDSLGSDHVVYFPSGTRNNIFDPGIFIEVQSKRFLSPNEFSISFIRDPLSPVCDTLLPFSSKNEDNIFNPGILASNEEKSPHLLSHRGFKAF
ncbi:hypothetical protein Tco_0438590 [Tanacetum coccineum]